jgi:glycosyltransferase involved in cell wall biosynthesis
MAKDVLEILTTPGLRLEMGRLARAKAEQFEMSAIGNQYLQLYQKLLNEQAN